MDLADQNVKTNLVSLPREPLQILDVVGPIPNADLSKYDGDDSLDARKEKRAHELYCLEIQLLSRNPRRYDSVYYEDSVHMNNFEKHYLKNYEYLQKHYDRVCLYLNEVRQKIAAGEWKSHNAIVFPAKIQTDCSDILFRLMHRHNFGWFFSVPPDPIILPDDYSQIVTNPMDLSTVKEKLESGAYNAICDFRNDVHLCFDNAILYHSESKNDEDQHNAKVACEAQKLKDIFDRDYQELNPDKNYRRWQDSLVDFLSNYYHPPNKEEINNTDTIVENEVILPVVHSDNLEIFQAEETIRRSLIDTQPHKRLKDNKISS